MNKKRLLKLANFLETLKPSQFDIDQWVSEVDPETNCGTVCCAIGWCPEVFPKYWKYRGANLLYRPTQENIYDLTHVENSGRQFFDLDYWDFRFLFMRTGYNNLKNITPKRVAKQIKKFIGEI